MENNRNNRYTYSTSDAERARRRAQRIAARKRRERARRIKMIKRMAPLLVLLAAVILVLVGILIGRAVTGSGGKAPDGFGKAAATVQGPLHRVPEGPEDGETPEGPFAASTTEATAQIPADEIISGYAVVIDVDDRTVVAEKNAFDVISPASMTKILTILVAAEHITNLDDTFTVTREITDYAYVNDCSSAGFMPDEKVPIRDLFYGTILPSGAEAALSLAIYTSGSHEAFVDLMNQKAEELGLGETAHFANCVGVFDESNVCTVYDIAVILKAAMDNDFCREVLSQHIYDIPANDFHPEGISLSNLFLRRIEDHIAEGIEVIGAKTGYVSQAGSCAASMATGADGKTYICVTAKAGSSWSAIYDHAALYEKYTGAGDAGTDTTAPEE